MFSKPLGLGLEWAFKIKPGVWAISIMYNLSLYFWILNLTKTNGFDVGSTKVYDSL